MAEKRVLRVRISFEEEQLFEAEKQKLGFNEPQTLRWILFHQNLIPNKEDDFKFKVMGTLLRIEKKLKEMEDKK